MARPKLAINEREIENYAKLGATNREIARMMGCDEGTVRGRFSAILDKARALRKISLRQAQWKAAMKGNPAMLIFLGKNELKQSDKQAHEITGKNGGPIRSMTSVDLRNLSEKELADLERIMQSANRRAGVPDTADPCRN